jgi:uncharacterized protein (DUF697 family)
MARIFDLFESWWGQLAAPKVSEAELNATLSKLRGQLPIPVFWLLGKAQSGKTSAIRSMTGSTRAEIGSGFRPCTQTASLYPFPSEEDRLFQFLDTRGLGEVEYDPSQDLAWCEGQAHLLIVVMRAMDHAQDAVLRAVREVKQRRPAWPVLVLQTSLHEGYPRRDSPHLLPYPFAGGAIPNETPEDLARSLRRQREWFTGGVFSSAPVEFVPVDLTLPEDGFTPHDYGLEALWGSIERLLPHGFRGMLEQFRDGREGFRDIYFRTAHPHVISYALAAGAAGAVPVPLVDIPVVLGIQAKMTHTIASIYNIELTRQRMAEIGGAIGIGFAGKLGVRGLVKLAPGVGSAMAAAYSAATTYALGRTLCVYFSHVLKGDVPTQAQFQKLYEQEFERARTRFKEYLAASTGQA